MPQIRRMTADDPGSLADAFASWNKPESQFQDYWAENQSGQRVTLIAWEGATLMGYGNLLRRSYYPPFAADGIPELNDLNVVPGSHGQGIGTLLIRALEDEARRQGYPRIGLGVGLTPSDARAQRLYPHLGYRLDGRGPIQTQWGPEAHLIKELNP
jgi:GNAT superfamily N-acetyltransferase